MKEEDHIQSVLKACRLLELISESKAPRGLMELSRAAELNKSTTRRLLSTLESAGFVKQPGSGDGYSLGGKLLRLGLAAVENLDLRGLAQAHLRQLTELSGEASNLAVLDGGKLIYIATVDSTKVTRTHTVLGVPADLHTSAIGKVLLSAMNDQEIIALTAEGLHRRTPHTITDISELLREISRVREQGCAYDMEEDDADMVCVAAPVLDAGIRPLTSDMKLMGRAFTILATDVYAQPKEPYKLELESVDQLQKDDVVVVTTNGSVSSGFWGFLSPSGTAYWRAASGPVCLWCRICATALPKAPQAGITRCPPGSIWPT